VHVPYAATLRVVELVIEQTFAGLAVKLTVSPDVAVAASETVAPAVCAEIEVKFIDCAIPRTLNVYPAFGEVSADDAP
jgi:hypothetical protein